MFIHILSSFLVFRSGTSASCNNLPTNSIWGCPPNYIIPDYTEITSNTINLCNFSMASNMILSGNNYTLYGNAFGCYAGPYNQNISDFLCCVDSATNTVSASASADARGTLNVDSRQTIGFLSQSASASAKATVKSVENVNNRQPSQTYPTISPEAEIPGNSQGRQPSYPPIQDWVPAINSLPPKACPDCLVNVTDYAAYVKAVGSLNRTQADNLFSNLDNQESTDIEDLLHQAATLVLNNEPSYSSSTSKFDLLAKTLDKEQSVAMVDFSLDIPHLNLGNSTVSVVKWQTNPYQNVSSWLIDTNVVSVVLSKLSGTQFASQTLTSPIQLAWNLNLDRNDVRIKQQVKLAHCTQPNQKLNFTCPSGNQTYTCQGVETVKAYCPAPKSYKAECLYWNTTTSGWAKDGCYQVYANSSYAVCNCTHLTNFATRLTAVYDSNTAIFLSTASVYSYAGLQKYYKFYIIFGSIAAIALVALGLGLWLDIRDSNKYFKLLFTDEIVQQLSNKGLLIDVCKENPPMEVSKFQHKDKGTQTEDNKKPTFLSIIWNRILFQHKQLSAFLRYDPRLSRVFRLFVVFIGLFNSLFLTGFMYSYTYGIENATLPSMTLLESFVLSLITACLNYPSQILFSSIVSSVGYEEFKWRYPVILAEIERRHNFENMVIGLQEEQLSIPNIDFEDIKNNPEVPTMVKKSHCKDLFYSLGSYFNDLISLLRCKKTKHVEALPEGSIKKAVYYAGQPYENPLAQPAYKQYLPFRTVSGGVVFAAAIGWFAWCLNYLILFSAYHSESVSDGILISFGINELETIVLIQPIVLLFYILIGLGVRKVQNYFTCFRKTPHKVPTLYFESDPYVKNYSTTFSTQLAYDIFLNIPSLVSHSGKQMHRYSKNLGYASIESVLDYISQKDDMIRFTKKEELVKELYTYVNEPNIFTKIPHLQVREPAA